MGVGIGHYYQNPEYLGQGQQKYVFEAVREEKDGKKVTDQGLVVSSGPVGLVSRVCQ